MWLTGRLAPDFKTIADFRHDNGAGIRNVCRRFVVLCRELKLFSQALVAIDSSKFKAVNSRDRNFTPAKIDKRKQQIEESIQRYLSALDTADRTLPAEFEAKNAQLKDKIKTLREQMRRMDEMRGAEAAARRAALADRPRRALDDLAGQGHRHGGLQRADRRRRQAPPHRRARGHQRRQRPGAAEQDGAGRTARRWARSSLQAYADRGYFSGPEIKACDEAGIKALRAQADDLECQGRGPLQQGRLHLHRQG